MRFWDSSAVVPLLVPEASSRRLQQMFRTDPVMMAWWATELECVSAITRRLREGLVSPTLADDALDRLTALRRSWQEVEPAEDLREAAKRFLRVHPLRTADAVQRAAAFRAAEGRPASLEFVSLDERLAAAARIEGFPVVSA